MCCIWGAIRATGWRVGAAGLRARHVWRRGLRGTKTTRMIVLVQIVARYSASAVTHQPHMHCAGGAAVSCAHSPVQRHTMVAAHVLKAPLSPTWKTELLPATLSVALLLKCSNLTASQSRVESTVSVRSDLKIDRRSLNLRGFATLDRRMARTGGDNTAHESGCGVS